MTVDDFWQEFIEYAGLHKSITYRNSYYFDSNEAGAKKLLDLVLLGKKKATTGALLAYEGNIPRVENDYSIITDWHGIPHCIVRTTAITIMPFNEMTFEICDREGEYDSLEAWRDDHIRYFKDEGYEFSEDMLIVFRDFEVVYKNL